MATKTDPFSIRLSKGVHDKLLAVIGACGNGDWSKSELIERALLSYFALLEVNSSMLEGYDRAQDKSVTQRTFSEHGSLWSNT